MPANLAIMAREAISIGPAGRRLAANVLALRKARGLNQPQLAARMQEQGRAVHATVVSKIEQRDRRVDVDDLVAIAIALGVTPNRLLLEVPSRAVVLERPGDSSGRPVDTFPAPAESIDLTPSVDVPLFDAWEWATGQHPLPGLPETASGEALFEFRKENRPHDPGDRDRYFDKDEFRKHPELVRQAAALVRAARDAGVSRGLLHDFVELADLIPANGDSESPVA